jgi:septal ring factor EnvC (AmiA/AmiB activator)
MTNKQKNIIFYAAVILFVVSLVTNIVFFNIKTNLRKAEKEYKETIKNLNTERDSLILAIDDLQMQREDLEEDLANLDRQNNSLKWQANKKSESNRYLEDLVETMAEERRRLVSKKDYTDEELADRLINDYYRKRDN